MGRAFVFLFVRRPVLSPPWAHADVLTGHIVRSVNVVWGSCEATVGFLNVANRLQPRCSLLPSCSLLILNTTQASRGLDGTDRTLASTTFNVEVGVVCRNRCHCDRCRHSSSSAPPWTQMGQIEHRR